LGVFSDSHEIGRNLGRENGLTGGGWLWGVHLGVFLD
jgi:hypothetical protein